MGTLVDMGGDDLVVNALIQGASAPIQGASSFASVSGAVMVPKYEAITDSQNQLTAAQYAVSHTVYVNDNVSGTFKIAGVSAVFGTASTSGTLQVEVATGTQALASGTNQLTGTMSLSGAANTAVNGTVIASPTTISAGSRVNLIYAGTVTNLVGGSVNIVLQRIS